MKINYIIMLLLAIPLSPFLNSCSSFMSIQDIQKEYGISKIPTQDELTNIDGVIILEKNDVDMDFDNNFNLFTTENVHIVKKIYKNFEYHSVINIPIYFGEKITNIEARTVNDDGTEIKLKSSDFYTISGEGDESVLYSDKKTIRFTFTGLVSGSIVEYKYSKQKSYPFMMDIWYIQHDLPVLRNIYRLHVPTILLKNDWKWIYKNYNYSIPEYTIFQPIAEKDRMVQSKTIFQWNIQNIPAFNYEPNMPPVMNHLAYVKFAPSDWKDWSDISRWYYNKVFIPQLIVSEKVNQSTKKLILLKSNETSQIQSCYEYVRDLRYISIAFGDGGIRPSTPDQVLERQYGDCKDKSILLISMLRGLNIKASPVLLLTKQRGELDMYFPNWNFNHMIVRAETKDKKIFWLDPTATDYPVNHLPWLCQGINVLVINDDGTASVEKTPMSSSIDNGTNHDIHMDILSSRSSVIRIKTSYQGIERYRRESDLINASNQDLRDYCKSLVINEFVDAEIDSAVHVNIDSNSNKLNLNFSFKTSNLVEVQGDLCFIKKDIFKFTNNLKWLSTENRKFPVIINYPYTLNKTISITWPISFAEKRNLPQTAKKDNYNFSFRLTCTQSDSNSIRLDETFQIKNHVIDPLEYKQTQQYFDQTNKAISEKIILKMK